MPEELDFAYNEINSRTSLFKDPNPGKLLSENRAYRRRDDIGRFVLFSYKLHTECNKLNRSECAII